MTEQEKHDRIRSRSDYRAFLDADMHAHGVGRWHWWRRFTNPELHYQRILRRTEFYLIAPIPLRPIYWVSRFRLARVSVLTGISVPPGVFGRGLSIAHVGSIVVNNHARVGKFCRLHSATNIGVGRGGCPILGDFVYVAPGAVISGSVHVGSSSLVGANSVVINDVPAGAVAVGAPAKVVSYKTSFESMPLWIQTQIRDRDLQE